MQNDSRSVNEQLREIGLDLDHAALRVAVQFPYWDGYQITHDPVYTAYSAPAGFINPTTTANTSPTEPTVCEIRDIGLNTTALIAALVLAIPVLLRIRTGKDQ